MGSLYESLSRISSCDYYPLLTPPFHSASVVFMDQMVYEMPEKR